MMRTRSSGRLTLAFVWTLCALLASCGDDDPASPGGGGGSTALSFNNFQDAAVVIGQVTKTSGAANAGATTGPIGLSNPFGAGAGSLYVPDQVNHRVLGFNAVPSSDGAAADFVLGQPDFTSNVSGVTAQNFNLPLDCTVSGSKLFLVDNGNRRVLIWNSLPTSNVPADVVVGQSDFTSNTAAVTQSGLASPARVAVAGGKMFVLDFSGNRLLIWNSIPTTNGAPASVVVGQADFTSSASGLSAASFGLPRALWTDGTRLVVGESTNDRVLIWNSIPTTNGVAADVVVGAADFVTQGSNIASATAIGDPWGVASDGTSLFVTDLTFNRVLIFRPFPTSNGAAAVGVLGQSNFTNGAANDANQDGANDGAPTARTMSSPTGVRARGNSLLVSDQNNHRVLVFRSN
jgi:hypothetical protein